MGDGAGNNKDSGADRSSNAEKKEIKETETADKTFAGGSMDCGLRRRS